MNQDFKDISVITDIAANTFAVFLLILLLLTAVRVDPPAVDGQANKMSLDAEADLASVLRRPLRPEDLIDMLYDHRSSARGTRIDLFEDRVEVLSGKPGREGTEPFVADTPQLAASVAAGWEAPVSLYVFDHRSYAAVIGGLLAARRAWRELSVPQALRRRDPASGRQAWTPGFLQLLAQPLDRASFRLALARLLGSAQPAAEASSQESGKSGYGGLSDPDLLTTPLLDALRRWWRAILNTAIVLGGFLFVLWVEVLCVEATGRSAEVGP